MIKLQTVHIVAKEWSFTSDQLQIHSGMVRFIVENKGKRKEPTPMNARLYVDP